MLLTNERAGRIAAVGYDPAASPRTAVTACNLCGGDRFVVLAHADRYGFAAPSHACLRCGLVFLDPRPTAEAYADFYRSVYRPLVSAYHGRLIDAESVEGEQVGYGQALADLLQSFAARVEGGRLLDIGGSTGVVAERLAERFQLRGTVLDPAPAELERARRRGLEVHVGTIETFDPGDRRFELVTLCQTVDHLLDIAGGLAKARSALAPDGLLFVDIVDLRAAYLREWSMERATKVDHPYGLTEPTAEAYLARAGFRALRKDYAADRLHVGYVCEASPPSPDALPPAEGVASFFAEIRWVQNTAPPT